MRRCGYGYPQPESAPAFFRQAREQCYALAQGLREVDPALHGVFGDLRDFALAALMGREQIEGFFFDDG